MGRRDLGAELTDALGQALRAADPDRPLLVAWSGGLDSTALLHLLVRDGRVRAALGGRGVIAAHLDHALREASAADARAVAETAEAWGVRLIRERLAAPPLSEEEGRDARYAFLDRAAADVGAELVCTAHHADDQVETVLFRIARGTGVAGLKGIPAYTPSRLRPLLLLDPPASRAQLEAYAAEHRLPVREDHTNALPGATRNRLRHEVLPLLDGVVPGASAALLRLARNARRHDAELGALADYAIERGGFDADVWASAPRALRRALLRHAAARHGVALDEAATAAALALAPDAQSGRGVDLPGGLRFERVFDRWQVRAVGDGAGADEPVVIADRTPGAGDLHIAGRHLRIVWNPEPSPAATLTLHPADTDFPLTLRGWRAGDRIRLPFGTTPLVKVWAEARVPAHERPARWVLTDRAGCVRAAEGLGPAVDPPTIRGTSPCAPLHLTLDTLE